MTVNNSTRIGRLPLGAGTLDNHHHHRSVHPTTAPSSSTKPTIKKDPSLSTMKTRHHRSCQSSCHSSSSSSLTTSNNKYGLAIGQKVTVSSMNTLGTIRFIGTTSFKPGTWVGIELDTVGIGKNSGMIDGVQYFDCPPETGLFILAKKVTPLKPSTVSPKKSLTTTTQCRQTPCVDPTRTLSPRRRCLSHDHHSPPPKKTPSVSTKPSRPPSRTLNRQPSPLCPPSSATRKSVTPALSSPRHQSKNTRQTVTPTTKKRNASLTCSTLKPAEPRKSKSTSTRQVVTQDELKKMHVLLEQSRQEKQRLSDEMNGKEAVWERLVAAKESYALKVDDLQKQIQRLQDALQASQQQLTQLQPTSTVDMEQQYLQRIDKLDRLVREWQQDAQDSHQQVQQQQRTYTAQIEQLRRDLAERDQVTAAMEREYEAAKQTHSVTIRQYEDTMMQWKADRDDAMASKDNHISRLEHMINELKACHFLLPPSPNNEQEGLFDIGYGDVTDLNSIEPSNGNTIHSSRRRLEQQLELTTIALEDVQQKQKVVTLENEQLREQLSHMHAASGAADQQFRQLQRELTAEINDKRMVMEERDLALQSQLRAEDNYKDLVLTNTRLEQQLEQRQNTQEKLLVVENKFVQLQHQHSLLLEQIHDAAKEKQLGSGLEDQSKDGTTQQPCDDDTSISHLQQVIVDMTLAMKKKSLRITELEKDLYQAEQRSMQPFDQHQRQRPYHHSAMCSGVIMPISPISDTPSSVITHSSLPPSRTHSRSGYSRSSFSSGDMSLMAVMNKEKTPHRSSTMYCVNCDVFDVHTTSDCPTQDETY